MSVHIWRAHVERGPHAGNRPGTLWSKHGLHRIWSTFLLWDRVPRKDGCHAQEVPARVQGHGVRVAHRGDPSIAEVAADFDISVGSVKRWKR